MMESSSSTIPPTTDSTTLMEEFQRDLNNYKKAIKEICDRQDTTQQTLVTIDQQLHGSNIETVDTMMQVIRAYREKLVGLRNRMMSLHSRGRVVKERALRIQQVAVSRSAARVEKIYYEENLIKKSPKHNPVPKDSSPNSVSSRDANVPSSEGDRDEPSHIDAK